MGIFNSLFGDKSKSMEGLSERDKQMAGLSESKSLPNPGSGVDLLNNAAIIETNPRPNDTGDPTARNDEARQQRAEEQAAVQAKTMEALRDSNQLVMRASESNALHDQARATVAAASPDQASAVEVGALINSDVEEDVVAKVNEQLLASGDVTELSGDVNVQPIITPSESEASTELTPASPELPDQLNNETSNAA